MNALRMGVGGLCLVVSVAVASACSANEVTGSPTASKSPVSSAAPTSAAPKAPTARPSGAPTSLPTSAAKPGASRSSSAAPTTSNQPVPKVQRSGQPARPSASAKPTSVDGTVAYSDGLRLQIRSVDFAKERKEQTGPGAFPGREYAVLSLVVDNRTAKSLSMNTVVITVLDAKDKPVDPVYVPEAKVSDFAGELKPGRTATARYAFAVPASSRSKVTVVVDFDGAHTSAVFRGKLA